MKDFLIYVRKSQNILRLQGLPKLTTFGLTFQEQNLMISNLKIARSQNVILKRPCLMIAGYMIAASTGATLQQVCEHQRFKAVRVLRK